jgi:hypothetical protein
VEDDPVAEDCEAVEEGAAEEDPVAEDCEAVEE